MPRRPKLAWTVLVPLVVLGLAAGCGGSSAQGDVPSANGGKAKPTPSASYDGRKFAQCMRDHGVDMPDPDPNGGGGLRSLAGSGQNQNTLHAALEACRDLAPPAIQNPSDPQAQAKRQKFAKCMRDHGYNMPDPDPNQPGFGLSGGVPNTADPQFQKAYDACKGELTGSGK